MSPELARVFEQAEQLAQRAGDNFVTVERLFALALPPARRGEGAGRGAGRSAEPQPGDRGRAQRPQGRQRFGRGGL